jgi:hypothetical protein
METFRSITKLPSTVENDINFMSNSAISISFSGTKHLVSNKFGLNMEILSGSVPVLSFHMPTSLRFGASTITAISNIGRMIT